MKELKIFTISGILFVLTTGTLAHFVYDWSGNNHMAGFFVPVSESVWEHMKLIFFPMLSYSILMVLKFKRKHPCVISAFCFGNLAGTLLIPILFYASYYMLGGSILIIDILIFISGVLIAFGLSYKLMLSCGLKPYTYFLLCLVCILFACFVSFTYHPPGLEIFKSPS